MLFANCPTVLTDKASALNLQPHANQSVIFDKVLNADRVSQSDLDRNSVPTTDPETIYFLTWLS